MPKKIQTESHILPRPPVVTVMGHIDHGKSTLLDYIRKENVVAKEAGGITQTLTAYEAVYKNKEGEEKNITFLDTPGHEAFLKMRSHSVSAADVAILIVSAEDGVKTQTIEAYKTIKKSGIPFIVAINKIDRPNANIERTKTTLTEQEIYLEGYGGDVPCVAISAKTGEGVPELLEMITLLSDMENFQGDLSKNAQGVILESHMNPKKGIAATLLIKDGTLRKGMFVTAGKNIAPIRTIENFLNVPIKEAKFSMPVSIGGWTNLPPAGIEFASHKTKKDAEEWVREHGANFMNAKVETSARQEEEKNTLVVPILIKAEAVGTIDAILYEIKKIHIEGVATKILATGVGAITENDIKNASSGEGIVVGFNVKADAQAKTLALRFGVVIVFFDIIYKLAEWMSEELERRRPRVEVEERKGTAKVIRRFGAAKGSYIVGGRVQEGTISLGDTVKILRRDFEISRGKITNLQQQKISSKQITEGLEFGAKIESKQEIAPGDIIETFAVVKK